MCRGNRKRDVSTMVTYSHASTPLGQSERAYYLSYFIKVDTSLFSKRVPRLLWALTWFGANLKTRKQRRQGYCYLRGFSSISLPPNLHTCMLPKMPFASVSSVYRGSHSASYTIPLLTPFTILNRTLLTLLITIWLQGYIRSHNPLDNAAMRKARRCFLYLIVTIRMILTN